MEQGDQTRWYLSRVGSDGARVVIEQMPFKVGRDASCQLRLLSERASRVHAHLNRSTVPNCLFLEDQQSANGTYVNGVRFVEPVPVGHGDLLRFAEEDWTLEFGDAPPVGTTVRALNLVEVAEKLSEEPDTAQVSTPGPF